MRLIQCPECHSSDIRFFETRNRYSCNNCGCGFSDQDNEVKKLRIFLSYGHDENEELVRLIKIDLEKRGHDVWFDKDEIKSGDEWRRSITDGILGSNRVLSFLSKYSTRDPGVCRDEIAIAIGVKGGNIQTILVESEQEVQPPVNISHIQWLDMHDWREKRNKDEHDWEAWYQSKVSEIIRVVESDESRRFAGEIEILNNYLKPIKSDARIFQLLKDGFYGRKWLFEAVENWRNNTNHDSRLFWIMGDPGVGKSAFAAQLTHTRSDIVIAAQFCEWDKSDHRDARRVVCSIAFQLATRLPDYRKLLLTLPEIKELDRKDASELFDYLLANPLRSIINGGRERHLIIIDALDEAGESGRNPLVEMLARNAHHLPTWLGIVVTSRLEFDVKTPFQALNPFQLDTKSDSNRADIRDYLNIKLAIQLQNQPNAEALMNQILEKCEGVFLYVERFCDDVEQKHISLDHPDQFPQGLGGIFAQYFQRQLPDLDKFREEIRPALRAILAAREPLPLEILQKLFNWKDEELRDFTYTLGSLFPVTKSSDSETIKPYHKSLADWIGDETKAGGYFVSRIEGHRILADYCLQNLQLDFISFSVEFCPQCGAHGLVLSRKPPVYVCGDCGFEGIPTAGNLSYVLMHILAHLHQSGRTQQVKELSENNRFAQARKRFGHPLRRILIINANDEGNFLASRMREDLTAWGQQVSPTIDQIPASTDWKNYTNSRLEWVASDSNRPAMVLYFMTPDSVRHGSHCYEENLCALSYTRGAVLPLMVIKCFPSIHLSHIQWLDMTGCIPISDHEQAYKQCFGLILETINNMHFHEFTSEMSRIRYALKPIESQSVVYRHLSRFIGRQWVFKEIDDWMLGNPPRQQIFWLCGGPGVGKSAICAAMSQRYRELVALHFCSWDRPDHQDAARVVRSLAFQLANRLPYYQKLLIALPEIAELDRKDANELFDYLLVNPLGSIINSGRERYLIVIDALDEASEAGLNPLAEMLVRSYHRLPDWIGIVVTSRPERVVTLLLQELTPFILDTEIESNRADISEYIRRELHSWLRGKEETKLIVDHILSLSEGVFLYAELFCNDVRNNNLSLIDPVHCPQGLGSIYMQYCLRYFPDIVKFQKDLRPALCVILAASEPLPLKILQQLCNWQDKDVHEFMWSIGSLFPIMNEAGIEIIKPYHKSFAIWLLDKVQAGPFFVSVEEGHRILSSLKQ